MTSKETLAKIESIIPLTDSILQLMLAPDEYIEYQAGQYLQILFKDEAYSYSIANAPLGSHKYELHIRHSPDNPHIEALLSDMKRIGAVSIRLPFGFCSLSHLRPDKPILFIAGGTGFAPIKAMIEQLLANGKTQPFELFWGARTQSDLYMDDKVSYWHTHVPHFQYVSELSGSEKGTLASQVLKRHAHDLHLWQMVISGPFDMVYDIRDCLLTAGAIQEDLFSDAFEGMEFVQNSVKE